MGVAYFAIKALLVTIICYFIFSFIGSIWLNHVKYEFGVAEVTSLASSISIFQRETYAQIVRKQLMETHDAILSEKSFPALPLSTGGIQGLVHLLYGSLSEFIAIYHAPLQTGGDSGRHLMNVSVSVLQGIVKKWSNQRQGIETYNKGMSYVHAIGEKTFVEITEDTSLLIYGRGLVPMTMGYWIWDALFSSIDPLSAIYTLSHYFRAVWISLGVGEFFSSLYDSAWILASGG